MLDVVTESGVWHLDLKNGSGAAGQGEPSNSADVTFVMTTAMFVDMFAGKLNPSDTRVLMMRAEIAMRENKPTIALDQARRAREIEPNALGLILMEARALKRMRETQQAVDLLTALPMEQAIVPEAVTLLAECLGALGRIDDATARVMDPP